MTDVVVEVRNLVKHFPAAAPVVSCGRSTA